ncbi:MAG: GNAT family N-acetyltransferase [Acidobacteriota bacterium]
MSNSVPANLAHLRIRLANKDDCERVTKLVSSVLAEFGLTTEPDGIDADLKDLEANYARRGGLFEVIEDGHGNLLGSFGLYPLNKTTCELRKMYFVPTARGSGLGKYILQRAIAQARELGFKQMVLETSSKLVAANHLYAKFGFEPATSDHLASRADQFYKLDL